MADANITLAIIGIALTLFLYGLDKIFDLIQNMGKSKPLDTIIYLKALLGLVAFLFGIWIFSLLGNISNTQFLIVLLFFVVVVTVLPLFFEISRKKKLRNRPI